MPRRRRIIPGLDRRDICGDETCDECYETVITAPTPSPSQRERLNAWPVPPPRPQIVRRPTYNAWSAVAQDYVAREIPEGEFYCTACSSPRPIEPQSNLATLLRREGNTAFCNECSERHYFQCDQCEALSSRSYGATLPDDSFVCANCFNEAYVHCSGCNEAVERGEIEHGYICEDCITDMVILPYNAKPTFTPLGVGPDHYGIELEVVHRSRARDDYGDIINSSAGLKRIARNVLGMFPSDFLIAKEDGSVSNGFELCTRPASFDLQKEAWGKFFENRPRSLRSYNTNDCGLHIHVSRKPLSLLQIGKMVAFVTHPQNYEFTTFVAQRDSHWGNFKVPKKITELHRNNTIQANSRASHRVPGNAQKYDAVNLLHQNSIEFRIFKGTLNETSFFKSLDFVKALVNFSAPAEQSIQALNTPTFKKYIETNNKLYPHLAQFIANGGSERNRA